MESRRRITEQISGSSRIAFLLNLGYELRLAERVVCWKGPHGPGSIKTLSCLNELGMVLQNQLRADLLGDDVGYPDDALDDVLWEKAETGNLTDVWLGVMERASRSSQKAAD